MNCEALKSKAEGIENDLLSMYVELNNVMFLS